MVPNTDAEFAKVSQEIPFSALRALLPEKTPTGDWIVDMEKFGRIVGWFGPLRDERSNKTIFNTVCFFFLLFFLKNFIHLVSNSTSFSFILLN
jgi:hypothetical protein